MKKETEMNYTRTDICEQQDIFNRISRLMKKYPCVLTMIRNELKIEIPTTASAFAQFMLKTNPEKEVMILRTLRKHEETANSMCFRDKRGRKIHQPLKANRATDIDSLMYVNPSRYLGQISRISSLEEASQLA
jgi:hypothetical protein